MIEYQPTAENPPEWPSSMLPYIISAYGYLIPQTVPGEWLSASDVATYVRRSYDITSGRNKEVYDFLTANNSLHFSKKGKKISMKRIHDNPGDIHIDIGSHNENPDHVKDFNNTVMKILMAIPGVKYAEAGRMGTGKWFYEVEWENQAFSRQENIDSPPALLAAARQFAASHRHRVPQGAFQRNPPLEILSARKEKKPGGGVTMYLHYRITAPMNSVKDVEKILKTLYPGWKAISHGSLKAGMYPNVKHAYGVTLVKTPELIRRTASGQIDPRNDDEETMRMIEDYRVVRGNPPLPASALMDIATAKTTAREVEEGLRPLGNLGTVDHLLDRGLQKLRGSHLGEVDWQNPGPGRIQRYKTKYPQSAVEIYRDIVEIKAVKRDGKRYVHKFGKGSHILGLPDGSILIESRKGKRLWKNFKAGG